VIGWTSLIAGAAVGFGSLALRTDRLDGVGGAGIGLMTFGLAQLIQPPALDAHQADALLTTEDWVKAARDEHALRRRWLGLGRLIMSVMWVGCGTGVLLIDDSAATRNSFGAGGVAFGVFEALAALHDLTTEGPIETALRAHEQGTGRVLWPKDATRGHFQVGIVAGGAMGSFAMTF
jgi:hypothetical protein